MNFITFEGPEGAGKSTVLGRVAEALRADGHLVLATREPGSGEFGARIRELLLHGADMCAEAELFLFLADRAEHMASTVAPALARGDWVLCDRHIDSTLVYQSIGRGLPSDFVQSANALATKGIAPRRTILFDIEPSLGLARIQHKDRMDAQPIEFHQRIRQGFLDLANLHPDRMRIIDASQDLEKVTKDALRAILEP
ncbi:MAG: dTMP kinase [Fimbriimonas sp.]